MIRCKLVKKEEAIGTIIKQRSTSITGDRKARYSLWSLGFIT
jgi:hypothetical protein